MSDSDDFLISSDEESDSDASSGFGVDDFEDSSSAESDASDFEDEDFEAKPVPKNKKKQAQAKQSKKTATASPASAPKKKTPPRKTSAGAGSSAQKKTPPASSASARAATSATKRTPVSAKGKGKAVAANPVANSPATARASPLSGSPQKPKSVRVSAPKKRSPTGSAKKRSPTSAVPSRQPAKKSKRSPQGKVRTATNATQLIDDYMKEKNRPYSVINVFENLRGAVSKAETQRIMDALADKGTLTKKTFGKALVYWYAQEGLPAYSPEELVTHRAELKALKATAAQLGQDLASRAAELNALKAEPTDTALAEVLAASCDELKQLEARRNAAEAASGSGSSVKAQNPDKLQAEFKKIRSVWGKRKRTVTEFLGKIADVTCKKEKILAEEMGLELDGQDGNPNLPPLNS